MVKPVVTDLADERKLKPSTAVCEPGSRLGFIPQSSREPPESGAQAPWKQEDWLRVLEAVRPRALLLSILALK